MEKVSNLRKLLIKQIQQLYDAEKQQQKALPHFAEMVGDNELRSIINGEAKDIGREISRLDKALDILEVTENSEQSPVMKLLLDETSGILANDEPKEVIDAEEVLALQQIKHYEIAVYGAVCAYAKALEEEEVAALLHENLEEEKRFDQRLTEVAKNMVNKKAKTPMSA